MALSERDVAVYRLLLDNCWNIVLLLPVIWPHVRVFDFVTIQTRDNPLRGPTQRVAQPWFANKCENAIFLC